MSGGKIKIGVLTDLSGPYEQNSGVGSVEAAKMAAEEFGNTINGVPVEIVSADHQNKPDIGAAIARRWFDLDGVDAVTDLVNSAVGFAVLEIAKTNNKAVLLTSAGSADFTGKACAPNTSVHWVYDSYEIGSAIGQALPQLGKTWFFITADYVFGRALQEGATAFIEKNGGKVIGSVRHPLGTSDFSSFMLQAQASKADVVAIANGGDDAINAVKTAREFGITEKQKVVPFGFEFAAGNPRHQPATRARHDVCLALAARFRRRGQGVLRQIRRAASYGAVELPSRHLFGCAQLSQGGGGDEFGRSENRVRQDARDQSGRRLHAERNAAARRPHGARRLSRADQSAGRIPKRVGSSQACRHHTGRQGLPAVGGRRLSRPCAMMTRRRGRPCRAGAVFASLQPNRGLAGKFFFTPPQPRRDCAVLLLYRLITAT